MITARRAASEQDLAGIETRLREEIDEAAEYALAEQYPEPHEALEDVYGELVH